MTETTSNGGTETAAAAPAAPEAPAAPATDGSGTAAAAALAAASAVGGSTATLAPGDRTCGVCGEAGHNRRTCPRVAHTEGAKVQVDRDGARACSICGQPGHNKRTCPRLAVPQSGEEAEKAKAALSMAGFAPAVGSNAQHSLVQAFAVATGLMHNPAAAAYRNGPDMVLSGLPGRVVPVSVGQGDGKVGEGVDGAGSKEVEEALLRRNNAEAAAAKAEEEATLAESKLENARKRKAMAPITVTYGATVNMNGRQFQCDSGA